MVKLAGRAGSDAMELCGACGMFEAGVEEVGLGDANIDCTVGGPLLRG